MAYTRSSRGRRSAGRGGYRTRAPARSRGGYVARRAPARRSTGRRSAGTRTRAGRAVQTVRIVMEGLPASNVSRPNPFARTMGLVPAVDMGRPRKAKL